MNDNIIEQGAVAAAESSLDHSILNAAHPAADDAAIVADAASIIAETDADLPEVEVEQKPNGFVLLGLAPELVQAVADLGYTQPTAVQAKAIPLAMNKGANATAFVDLMVSSQTGSGKTAAFLLPVLHTLLEQQAEMEAEGRAEFERAVAEAAANGEPAPKRKRKDPTNPRNFKAAAPGALILCPTRELAQQVAQDAIELVKHCRGLRVANVVGGIPYQLQIAKLQNANLVVATPGRLLDLQRSMQIKLDKVQFLVVDEADRMLDLGFSDDLAEVNQMTAQRQQTMMFSATFASRIQQLAMRVMHDNGAGVKKIQIDSPQEKHSSIKQVLFWADNAQHKRKLLDHWLRDTTINQAIVFASTQVECDGLATDLQQEGFSAVALHGALSQGLRNRRLQALRGGQVQILVATDVAARGIDVPTITHVFNYGLPMKAEDYTHRIGRTGRAGRSGLAVTFAEFRDRRRIFDIEAFTRQQFTSEVVPGLEPTQRAPQGGRSDAGRGGGGGGRDYSPRGRSGGFGGGGGGGRSFGGGGGGFGGGDRGRSFGGGGDRGGFGGGGDRGGFGGGDRGGDRGGFGGGDRGGDRGGFGGGGDRGAGGFGAPRAAAPRDDRGFAPRGEGFGGAPRRDGEGFAPRKPAFADNRGGDRGGFGGGDRAPAREYGARPAYAGKPAGGPGGKPSFTPHDARKRPARPAR
ncbi:DEAD/DEAH box helicase [Acidovorax sp. Be4]|uniref:DEAD/DEAH box helicase n=1 Tax=Acidovorax bellezanensis TaxID=2976702 RepID=A0ABT2PH71_9BURK|nr:DEAD/DEAH box helicase [Acidovorax sp. Be4]MCT9809478.1 DEAD/DEAH box helicase [Acidovorax sp. Be4]